MAITINQLRKAIAETHEIVESLEHHFPQPILVEMGGKFLFRHREQNDLLLSYLKCVRAISSLNACVILLENGFVQEIGTLCRCIDDFNQDVLFLAGPLGENGLSEQQKRLVDEFFQEEFNDIDNPLSATQQRNRVPRSKVLAGISRISGQPVNPSDFQEVQRTVQQGFSGYVHGAYGHIMEIYGGSPDSLHYHMKGLSETPRITEWTEALSSYVYRTMIAVEVVAKRCTAVSAVEAIRAARACLEETLDVSNDPKKILDRIKRK